MKGRTLEWAIERGLFLCATISVPTTASIVAERSIETIQCLRKVSIFEFLTGTEWTPLFAQKHFGVLPLAIATGAGSGAQRAIGTGVLGGMVAGVTLGLFFIPLFLVVIERLFVQRKAHD